VHEPQAFKAYGWVACAWILVVSFQYGYHISALNQIQAVLTCRNSGTQPPDSYLSLPTCIPMSDPTFSVVTSVYNVGGLMGSAGANVFMDRYGRKGAILISSVATLLGAGLMGIAASLTPLLFGRLIVGMGAGLGLCVAPIFVSEIAPPKMRGAVGVLTQFSTVIGIMVTQGLGLSLADPHLWRFVLLFAAALSALQLLWAPMMIESPTWLNRHGLLHDKDKAARRLWKSGQIMRSPDAPNDDSEDPLLEAADRDEEEDEHLSPTDREEHAEALNVPKALVRPEVRRPLIIVCFSMLAQQLSGINAVLYYSNDILSKALPEFGPYVSLGITIVNFIATALPVFLIDRMGRKQLLSISVGGALISLLGVGIGLNARLITLASITIVSFVASFAVGLGPVPFVMIPEVSPHYAVSALSSIGLSLNWIANFTVGLVFLPLRNFLSGGDPSKEGRVFFVFAAMLFFCVSVLFRAYRG